MSDSQSETKNYRSTLNLFSTDFPMRANAAVTDVEIQERWARDNVSYKCMNVNKENESFYLHDGPPYANGDIHLGHAYNKILKDIIVKERRMSGYYAPVTPGWDCHGLPIEQKVLSENPGSQGPGFKALCRSYAQKWIDRQRDSFKKLGVFMDWDSPYITMSYNYEASIMKSFSKLVSSGYVKRMKKTVPWCTSCKTALASAEIEYADRKDPSIYVLFKADCQDLKSRIDLGQLQDTDVSLLVWTTTPWTLPLNRALMLKKDGEYVLVRSEGRHLIIGRGVLEKLSVVTEREYEVLGNIASSDLEGLKVIHPFDSSRFVPVILDDSVGAEDGTACVHTAPGCGPLDYEIGVKNGLEIYSPISDEGNYDSHILPSSLAGISIADAPKYVFTHLKEKDSLWFKTSIRHSYPHCWRCRNPLIFRATPQWFFDLYAHDLQKNVLEKVEEVDFLPAAGKNFLKATVSSRWEWCLSRQRSWGVPIPALLHKDGEQIWINSNFIDYIAKGVKENGIEYWDTITLEELKEKEVLPQEFPIEDYIKEDDILDVWFDSGVSHTAVLGKQNQYPADMYLEGIDQHRGWFQSSLITSVALHGEKPMKSIMTHGFTVDEHGQKMSKSLGNVVLPEEIIKKIGTDGLRLWVASVGNEGDAVVSDQFLKNVSEVYRKIRNTCRFLLQNTADFRWDKDHINLNDLHPFDLYALRKTFRIYIKCLKAYRDTNLTHVFHMLSDFTVSFLSAIYFDSLKDALYCDGENSWRRRSAQTSLYIILDMITRLIAPVMSHTADLVADHYKGRKDVSIHLEGFSRMEFLFELGDAYDMSKKVITREVLQALDEKLSSDLGEQDYMACWDALLDMRGVVMKGLEERRKEGSIKHSLEAAILISLGDEWELNEAFKNFKKLFDSDEAVCKFLADFFVVSSVQFSAGSNISVSVRAFDGNKCLRCWKWHSEKGDLCLRCINI